MGIHGLKLSFLAPGQSEQMVRQFLETARVAVPAIAAAPVVAEAAAGIGIGVGAFALPALFLGGDSSTPEPLPPPIDTRPRDHYNQHEIDQAIKLIHQHHELQRQFGESAFAYVARVNKLVTDRETLQSLAAEAAAMGISAGALGAVLGSVHAESRSPSKPWSRDEFAEVFQNGNDFVAAVVSHPQPYGYSGLRWLLTARVGNEYLYNWLGLDQVAPQVWLTQRFASNANLIFNYLALFRDDVLYGGKPDVVELINLGPEELRHHLLETDMHTSAFLLSWARIFTPSDFVVDRTFSSDYIPSAELESIEVARRRVDTKLEILHRHMEELEKLGSLAEAEEVRREIQTLIAARAHNTFLLARIVEENLTNPASPKEITVFPHEMSDAARTCYEKIVAQFQKRWDFLEESTNEIERAEALLKLVDKYHDQAAIDKAQQLVIVARGKVAQKILGFVPQDFRVYREGVHLFFILHHADFIRAAYNLSLKSPGQESAASLEPWPQLRKGRQVDYAKKAERWGGLAYRGGISLMNVDKPLSVETVSAHELRHQYDSLVREAMEHLPFPLLAVRDHGVPEQALARSFWTESNALLAESLVANPRKFPANSFFASDTYDPLSRSGKGSNKEWKNTPTLGFYDDTRRLGISIRSDLQAIWRRLDTMEKTEKTALPQNSPDQQEVHDRYLQLKLILISYLEVGTDATMEKLEAWLNLQLDGKFGRISSLPRDLRAEEGTRVVNISETGTVDIRLSSGDFYADFDIRDHSGALLARLNAIYREGSYYVRARQPGIVLNREELSQEYYDKVRAGKTVRLLIAGQSFEVEFVKMRPMGMFESFWSEFF